MITFWTNRAGRFGIELYLEKRGASLRDRFEVREYESIAPHMRLSGGPHIFSAIDQLSPAQRRAMSDVHDQLRSANAHARLINEPSRVQLRYQLATTLWQQGINTFRIHRATSASEVTRFPVFLREESRHTGNKSGLLHDAAALYRGLWALRLRGYRLRDLLIVEFCDTKDAAGSYRKYSAFCVGGAIVPAHMMAGPDWMMKAHRASPDVDLAQQELEFVEQNPHEALLSRVFELAHIQFGRIDYGVLNGVPQVWEINTNPTMGRNPSGSRKPVARNVEALRDQARAAYHARLRPAFEALALEGRQDQGVEVALDSALVKRAAAERAVIDRRHRAYSMVRRLYEHRHAATLRTVVRLVAPRSGELHTPS